MNLLLEQPQICQKMGQNGKAYVQEEYNWNTVIDRFETALKKFELL